MFADDLFTLLDTNSANLPKNDNTPQADVTATNDNLNTQTAEPTDSTSWIEEDAKSWQVKTTTDTTTTAKTTKNILPVYFPTLVDLPPVPAKPCSSPAVPLATAATTTDDPATTPCHSVSDDEAAVSSTPSLSLQPNNLNDFEANNVEPSSIASIPVPPSLPPPPPPEPEEEDDVAFLLRTKNQFAEWIRNAYRADHTKNQTSEGRLQTSLCEDVNCLVRVHVEALLERFIDAVDDESEDKAYNDNIEKGQKGLPDGDNQVDQHSSKRQQDEEPSVEVTFNGNSAMVALVVQGSIGMLQKIVEEQTTYRDEYYSNSHSTKGDEDDVDEEDLYIETCCSAANDCLRMSDTFESIMGDLQERLIKEEPESETGLISALDEHVNILLRLYNRHAVFYAQRIADKIIEVIEMAISEELFGKTWLHDHTQNDLALVMIRTMDDFMEDWQTYLDPILHIRVLEAMVTAICNFYVKTLVQKSAHHLSLNKSIWKHDIRLGLDRMMGDVQIIRNYFDDFAQSAYPTMTRVVGDELEVLETMQEILAIGAGFAAWSDLNDFVLLLHKRLQSAGLTKYVIGDLVHLMNPQLEKAAYELVDSMHPILETMTSKQRKRDVNTMGLSLTESLLEVCRESHRLRLRPGLNNGDDVLEQGEIVLGMVSRQSTKYRRKMVKSIQKHSKQQGQNLNKTMSSLSKMAGSPTQNRMSKGIIPSFSPGNNRPTQRSSSRPIISQLGRDSLAASKKESSSKKIAARLSKYKERFG